MLRIILILSLVLAGCGPSREYPPLGQANDIAIWNDNTGQSEFVIPNINYVQGTFWDIDKEFYRVNGDGEPVRIARIDMALTGQWKWISKVEEK